MCTSTFILPERVSANIYVQSIDQVKIMLNLELQYMYT
jgi:hypothetical protein